MVDIPCVGIVLGCVYGTPCLGEDRAEQAHAPTHEIKDI
jgi:hypothetical protein